MKLNFLIIGAQKAGSTFVHNCLREHPEVFIPRQEISFFEDPDYDQNEISRFNTLFAAVKNEKVIGVKRPDYLARPECPERIYSHYPDARLVVVLRNPVERIVSAYFWYMQVGIIPVRPLEEGLQDILAGKYETQYPKSREIIYYGNYYDQLMRYLKFFDQDQLLIVLYEDLRKNPAGTLSKVYDFLGIDRNFTARSLSKHPKETVYALSRLRWLSLANRWFFYNYGFYNDNILVLHPKDNRLSRFFYYLFVAVDRYLLVHMFGNTKPALSPSLHNRVVEIYEKDITALEKHFGWNLSKWQKRIE